MTEVPIQAYSLARSAVFHAESLMGPLVDFLSTRERPPLPFDNPELFKHARLELVKLLKDDSARIAAGVYPLQVLRPESPFKHLKRIPVMFADALSIARRRKTGQTRDFSREASELVDETPDYYRRGFHFQSDGYLSRKSAELYEHQVEVLFGGAADAMRRLVVVELRRHFGSGDGEGLKFLELGAGTGRATRFVRLAFPKAKIVALDLSGPYLKLAQENLRSYSRHDFVEGDAEHVPFMSETFDAVYSVFLFHELPLAVRHGVLQEAMRVLKPGGQFAMVDSLQLGDVPELDSALEMFPQRFHEPFYKNYLLNPMPELMREAGLRSVRVQTGFFSKAVSGVKA